MTSLQTRHIPVLLNEVLEQLQPEGDSARSMFLDCTLGGGGHSEAFLRSYPELFLIGIDRDSRAIERVRARLQEFSDRSYLICGNFGDVDRHIEQLPAEISALFTAAGGKFQRILVDLGLSSDQLDDAERGFSFRTDAPLDMRMDQELPRTAEQVVNEYELRDLKRVLQRGGVGVRSGSLAKAIVAKRPLHTTQELADICNTVLRIPGPPPKQSLSTVPFQAIRIEVNDEFGSLERFLDLVIEYLAPKGRLAVISFHSLEDQLVTKQMRRWSRADATMSKVPLVGDSAVTGRLLTSSAITPSENEITENPRARSARLRVFEKSNSQVLQ